MGPPKRVRRVSTIAIVTGADAPNLTADGQRLRAALDGRGHDAVAVRWNDAAVDWDRFDAAVVRSCWTYYVDPDGFRDWLDELERAGVSVRNPPDAIRWNIHKSYLRDLADAGVSIVPTEVVPDTRETELAAILETRGWDEAVVKPAIGTSAAGAWKTTRDGTDADQSRFERPFRGARRSGSATATEGDGPRLSRRGALVQQYVPEVADGEHSLVFVGGEFSHAWRGLRTPDSFGVSPNFDENAAYDPSNNTISWGSDVLRTARTRLDVDPATLPYARVDFVRRGDEPLLMELELIEPYLNLPGAGAADRLAAALLSSLEIPA